MAQEDLLQAACRDPDVHPDLFYPEDKLTAEAAKKVCRACPVAAACLRDAFATGDNWGVLGATTKRERRAMVKKHRIARQEKAA